ncbi:MAG TPA: helicase-associated domain-containing protein [Anaerolineae bacterium]|nr:helicase-associated domain-containing protein [Anaerolineae bacterium]
MRPLSQMLSEHELIVLRVIGEWYELDLTGANKVACVQALTGVIANLDLELEIQYLPLEEAAALRALVAGGGRLPLATFSRSYGEVRQMGPGRLERDEPWLAPENAAEGLWYRGFLQRAFDETDDGLVEFYYLPQELYDKFPQDEVEDEVVSRNEHSWPEVTPAPGSWSVAETSIVDDMTTLLAAAQKDVLTAELSETVAGWLLNKTASRYQLLLLLAEEMGMLRRSETGLRPTRDTVDWLQKGREQQCQLLAEAWRDSQWRELYHVPMLVCEGDGWQYDPRLVREVLLATMPLTTKWYAWKDVLAYIHENDPDFQRPDGDYDSWYIREVQQMGYLSGFSSWWDVEGRQLIYLLTHVLPWLGMVEHSAAGTTAAGEVGVNCYRLTARGLAWLRGEEPEGDKVTVPLVVQSNGEIVVPFNAGRYERFQVARVTVPWPVVVGEPFSYRLTPRSLMQAKEQGIQVGRIMDFLREASERPLPASVKRALKRWQERGTEGKVSGVVVLRVREAEILETLRQNSKTQPYLGESLGSLAVIIQHDQWPEFCQAVAELGLLLDIEVDY